DRERGGDGLVRRHVEPYLPGRAAGCVPGAADAERPALCQASGERDQPGVLAVVRAQQAVDELSVRLDRRAVRAADDEVPVSDVDLARLAGPQILARVGPPALETQPLAAGRQRR